MTDIALFMETYKRAWETSDENLLANLFAENGIYRYTPFAEQHGREAIKAYWQRTKPQSDIHLAYEVLQRHEHGGIAHWRVTYQATSEDLYRIWAGSSDRDLLVREEGDPLPRLVLDGAAVVELDAEGLCREFRIWWHSQIAKD